MKIVQIILTAFCISVTALSGATHSVGAAGDFATIQGAIDDGGTVAGDIISIIDAVHTEEGITVNKNLTIRGAGMASTIVQAHASEASATDRVFSISSGATVTVEDMTIQHGNVSASGGGGIYSEGILTVTRCHVFYNISDLSGGGICSLGSLTITDSTIESNYVSSTLNMGAGIYHAPSSPADTLTMSGCYISGNSSEMGGGIAVFANESGATAVPVLIENCTIKGNFARDTTFGWGGGCQFSTRTLSGGASAVLTVEMRNCTIFKNGASNSGTCLYIHVEEASSSTAIQNLTLVNCVLGNKSAAADGHIELSQSAGAELNFTRLNTVFEFDCILGGHGTNGNLDNADPLLLPPADNGGLTFTAAMEAGSPLINAGTSTGVPVVDQRGYARFGLPDIGAFEFQPAILTTAAASSITKNSAQSGGEVTSEGDGTVSERGVCWNTTGTPTISDNTMASGSGLGPFIAGLTSLASSTSYYVRAYAFNEAGTAYGGVETFDTLASANSPDDSSGCAPGTASPSSILFPILTGFALVLIRKMRR